MKIPEKLLNAIGLEPMTNRDVIVAELAELTDEQFDRFLKGNKIGLVGTLQTRSYDAQDGSKRYVTEVIVENVEFVAPRQDSGTNYGSPPPAQQRQQPQQRNEQQRMDMASQGFQEVEDDDELPF